MAAEHATLMVLKVDLECSSCFLKVKKVLGKFPQIGDQVYDWKQNEVTISVICCDPQKIRRKLYSMAGKAIKNIEIKESGKQKPKDKDKDAEKPKAAEKPKDVQQSKDVKKPKEAEKKVAFADTEKPKSNGKSDKPKADEGKSDKPKTDEKATKPAMKPTKADPSKTPESAPKGTPVPEPVKMSGAANIFTGPANGYPMQMYPPGFPAATYCGQCHDGYGGGPCHHGYGMPVPPPHAPLGYGYEYGYGGNRGFNANRLDYFSEENPSGCSIM